jgi:putative ABC transport system permease protein
MLAVGMALGAGAILPRELEAGYAAINPAHAAFVSDPFDERFVESVREMPGVRDAEGRRSVVVRLRTGPSEWRDLRLFAIPDFDHIRINKIEPEGGAWPPPVQTLLIERGALSLTKAQVGDTVLIETPDFRQHEIRIVGLAHDQSLQPAAFEGKAYGYITFETLAKLGQPRDYNELYILVSENALDRQHIRNVAQSVRDKMERSGLVVTSTSTPVPGKHPLEDPAQAVMLLLGVLGFFSLIFSGSLVANTLSAVLVQQVRQIGMMKAIGARTYQVAGIYLGMALILGLLAGMIGAPLGMLGARGLAGFVAGLLNADIVNPSVPFIVLVLEAVIGLAVPLLTALLPVLSGSRVTVRDALNDYGLDTRQYGAGSVDRLLGRLRDLPRAVTLGLGNTFRRKGRLALTLFTLTLGSAAFVAVASVYASAMLSLEDVMRYWDYDTIAQFSRPYRIDELESQALSVPGVAKAEHWSVIGTRRLHDDGNEGENIWMFALPAQTISLRPNLLAGRWLQADDEDAIVISNKFLDEEPGVGVGDEITLKVRGKKTSWHVVGILHMMMTPGPMVYVNSPYYAELAGMVGRADGLYIVTTQHDAESQAQVMRALEETFKANGVRVQSIQAISDVRNGFQALFVAIVALLLIMALLLIVVGGLGLTGAMGLNVLERGREIGVMRAIGGSGRIVRQIILTEGTVIGVLSWMFGCILALPLSQLLSDALGRAIMQVPFIYTFSVAGALVWLVLVIALTAAASLLPARRAARLTVREVLAYQ